MIPIDPEVKMALKYYRKKRNARDQLFIFFSPNSSQAFHFQIFNLRDENNSYQAAKLWPARQQI